MKRIAISQSNYIPWKGYFDSINMVDEFILYDDMQYTRRDWRNRNKIKTKDGIKWLSIPIDVKGKYSQKICEAKISDTSWANNHWKTIYHNYHKAPFFNQYKDIFENIYLNNKEKYLCDINFMFIGAICDILDIKVLFKLSSEFDLIEGKTERLVDICKKRNATDYFSAPAAKSYLNESLFEQENIKVHYMDYSGYPEYGQLYDGFDHAVSILDLIFNEGPDTRKFMKSFIPGIDKKEFRKAI
jgi:hypothetical protein